MDFSRLGALVLALFSTWACSAGPVASKPVSSPAPPSAKPESEQKTLFRLLHDVPRPAPVLDALPAGARALLDEELDKAGGEGVERLMQDPALVLKRPLLYLAAGGSSLSVYARALETDSMIEEWNWLAGTTLQRAGAADAEAQWLAVANELGSRTAQYLLRERAADFAEGRTPRVAVIREVIRAAAILKRAEIEGRALEHLADLEPSSEAFSALATWYARQERLQDAERALAAATEHEPVNERMHRFAQGRIEVARQLSQAEAPTNLEERVRTARTYLKLFRYEEAREVLEPVSTAGWGKHLGFSTEWLRARLEVPTCPEVAMPHPALCRLGWKQAMTAGDFAALASAWASGAGRDRESVENYLGLSFVTPIQYRLATDAQPWTEEQLVRALTSLERSAREAKAVATRFEGLALFAEAIRTAYQSSFEQDGESVQTARRALLTRSMELIAREPANDWFQAAALAMLALSIQHDAVGPELARLERQIAPVYVTSLGTLQLWNVLATGDHQRLEPLKHLLVEIAQQTEVDGIERSKWLLLWAESDAHLDPTPNTLATVEQMSKRLRDDSVPLSLRLRAALNLAGLRAREGKLTEAAESLSAATANVGKATVQSQDEQELLIAALGYIQVLRGVSNSGQVREKAARELERLLREVSEQGAAPPTLQVWLALWRGELEALMIEERCGQAAECRRQANAARGIAPEQLTARVGAVTSKLLDHGVVPIGGAGMDIRYGDGGQLDLRIEVSTSFPLVQVPKFD